MTMHNDGKLHIIHILTAEGWQEFDHGFPWPHEIARELVCSLFCRGIIVKTEVCS
jgi:hypothetical protein